MVTKAIKRLGFRFQKSAQTENKSMKLYQEDIDALNVIGKYIEESQKRTIVANKLFSKLYITMMGEFMRYYKTDQTDIPAKEINRILASNLSTALAFYIEKKDTQHLNNIEDQDGFNDFKESDPKKEWEKLSIMINEVIESFSSIK